jgi:hypothetical protein
MQKNTAEINKNIGNVGLEFTYTIFLSLMVVLFFGLGVSAFYPAPTSPDYPSSLTMPVKDDVMDQRTIDAQADYEKTYEKYQNDMSTYNRNVSIIILVLAIGTTVISLIFLENMHVISNGLLLGGVFTLIYSMGRGFATDDTQFRFVMVSVGLVIALILGYIKFIRPNNQTNTAKK